jgi:hypothetical protein
MKESIVGDLDVPFSLVMKNYERFSLIESKKKMWLSERSVLCVVIKFNQYHLSTFFMCFLCDGATGR